MTNWADDIIEEETDDEEIRSDGDVLGEVTGKAKKKVASVQRDIPVEEQWEIDAEVLETRKVCSSPCSPKYVRNVDRKETLHKGTVSSELSSL